MKKFMVAALITAAFLTGCGTATPAQSAEPAPAVSAAVQSINANTEKPAHKEPVFLVIIIIICL